MGASQSSYVREAVKELLIADEDVEETDEEIGRGQYSSVRIVKVNGLLCASKKLHKSYTDGKQQNDPMVQRFVEECMRMSKLRHPNIVQFMGVHFGKSPIPSLVMELMPTNLGSFLDDYRNVPNFVKNSILFDVSLGLLYMHKQNPPIIHRNLTVNSVLISNALHAKITDLGVAKVLDIKHSSHPPRMSISPGSSICMPPEACVEKPTYDSKLDIFSFGHMIVHVVIQRWPTPLPKLCCTELAEMKSVQRTEIQRRENYIADMGSGNPLQKLAVLCLQDKPNLRPTTAAVAQEMQHLFLETPPIYSNPVEILEALENQRTAAELKATVADLEYKLQLNQKELISKAATIQELRGQLGLPKSPKVIPRPIPRRRNLPPKENLPPVPRPRAATSGALSRPTRRGRSPSPTPPHPAAAPETNGQMHPKPHPRGFAYTTTPGAAKQPAVAADVQLAALLARQSDKLHDN